MENKTKISFLIPTYINHFKYVKNFTNSFKYCSDIDDIDINIIVSNENEQKQLNQIIEEETKIYNINIIDFNIIFNTIFETSYNDNEILQEISNNVDKRHLDRFFYQSLKKILFAYYNSNYDIYYIIDSESMFIENINIHNYVENFLRTKQIIYNSKSRLNNDSYRFFNKFFYSKSKINSTALCTYNWVFEKKILLDFLSEFVKIIKLNDFKTLLSGNNAIFIENCYYYYINANNEKYNYNFIDINVNSDISNIQCKLSYEFMEDIRKYITNDKEIQLASNIFLANNIQNYKPNEDYNENDIKFMKSAKIKLLVSGVSSKLYNRIEMENILKQKVRNFKIFENTIINNSLIPLNEDKVYLYSFLDRNKSETIDNIDNYLKNDIENMKELDNNNYYFVIENIWNANFHHCLNETVLLMDIYMKYFNKFPNIKILLKKKKYSGFYQKFIDMLPETKIVYINKEKLSKGNFIYILPYAAYDKSIEKIKDTFSIHSRPMISEIINKANKCYDSNKIKKIYISRRNICNKSWHNRYLTNIEEISNNIIKRGYTEIYTDEIEDFLYQVYLINNADEIILELGAGCDNIIFMKENSKMTIIGNNTKESHLWIKRFYIYNNKVKIQEKLFGETDKTSKYYSDDIVNKYNLPYRYIENCFY